MDEHCGATARPEGGSKLRVGLLLDAGPAVGMGHVMRSTSVMESLLRTGADTVVVLTSTPGWVRQSLDRFDDDMEIVPVGYEAGTLHAMVQDLGLGVVIIDTPQLTDARTVHRLKSNTIVVAIQNKTEAGLASHILVFPDAHNDHRVKEMCQQVGTVGSPDVVLFGWPYVLLSADAVALGPFHGKRHEEIVISAGGSDPTAMVRLLVDWLQELGLTMPVRVLRGQMQSGDASAGASWASEGITESPFASEHLRSARLAIVAMGVTAYECLYWRTPVVTVGRDAESGRLSDRLAAQRYGWSLGAMDDVTPAALEATLSRALRSCQTAGEPVAPGPVDGKGADRLVHAILEYQGTRG